MVVIGRDGIQKKKPVADETVIQVALSGEAKQAPFEVKPTKPACKWFVGRRGVVPSRARIASMRLSLVLQAMLLLALSLSVLWVVGMDNNNCTNLVEDGETEGMIGVCRMARFLVFADMVTVQACLLLLMLEVYGKSHLLKIRRG